MKRDPITEKICALVTGSLAFPLAIVIKIVIALSIHSLFKGSYDRGIPIVFQPLCDYLGWDRKRYLVSGMLYKNLHECLEELQRWILGSAGIKVPESDSCDT